MQYLGMKNIVALADSPAMGLKRNGVIRKVFQVEIHQTWCLNVKEEGQDWVF